MSDPAKTTVLVSRKWTNPQISVTLTNKGIEIGMTLEEFLVCFKRELETRLTLVRKANFTAQFQDAQAAVVQEMKEQSKFVMV